VAVEISTVEVKLRGPPTISIFGRYLTVGMAVGLSTNGSRPSMETAGLVWSSAAIKA